MFVSFILALVIGQLSPVPVTVRHDEKPVAGAAVTCGVFTGATDAQGRVSVTVTAPGCTLVVTHEGLLPFSQDITPASPPLLVDLEEAPEVEEEVIVTATRTGRLAKDQVTRVEVVTREEIEEKLLMTPGDIVMLLNETSGIRLQPTAPALGAASVRVQGMPGRFTAVLTDGLPLGGTQVASLGLLQIAPMDLQQVEVIKGAASALYGPSALGGVINLVTRRPTPAHEGELLLNATSRSGGDGLLWLSGPVSPTWGYTFLTGAHAQNFVDVDDDDWADLPRFRRFIAKPKLTWISPTHGSVDLSGGLTVEARRGGSATNLAARQSVDTTRVDLGGVWRRPGLGGVLIAKGVASVLAHDHEYGLDAYEDTHTSSLAEVSLSRPVGKHMVVAGAAVELNRYRNRAFRTFDYSWTTPGVFVQGDVAFSPNVSLSVSARVDAHPEFGALWSPRLSVRARPSGWDVRGSVGRGAFAPTVFVDEVEEVGLAALLPTRPTHAETAETASLDVSRGFGPIEVSGTVFGSRIQHAVRTQVRQGRLEVIQLFDYWLNDTRTRGVEVFGRFRRGPWVATAAHTWIRATQLELRGRHSSEDVPLTPKRMFSFIAAWEQHGTARVGLEVYRTGAQRLEDNPYREESAPYTILGLLGERRFGRLRVFLNLENLTGVRQSDYDPVLRPQPSVIGQYSVSAWAPLEGRTINGGIRIGF
jgi:outer membrane receptor for ferrienterochelin and colicins